MSCKPAHGGTKGWYPVSPCKSGTSSPQPSADDSHETEAFPLCLCDGIGDTAKVETLVEFKALQIM